MNFKISVIVPVYKVEKYLDRCVTSIVNQTYQNLEIILVDDGSPDNCPEICDQWAKKDIRIKVIHQENRGLSAARNAGLDIATGDFIGFIDSDDWIHKDMYTYLLGLINEHNGDIAQCSFIRTETFFYDSIQNSVEVRVLNNHEAILDLYNTERGTDAVIACNKIYKKELYNRIRYPEGKLFEDAYTTYKIFYEANNIIISDRKLYYYFQSEFSITRGNFQPRRIEGLYANKEEIMFFKNINEKVIVKNAQKLFCNRLLNEYIYFYGHRKEGIEGCKILAYEIKRNIYSFIFNKYIKLSTKMRLICFVISPYIYYRLISVIVSKQ